MKKFFQVALMALTVVFMASCVAGGSGNYKEGDPAPEIDYNNATVNGIAYDDEIDACWKTDVTAKFMGFKVSLTYYDWGSEFDIVAIHEQTAWMCAQSGYSSYRYVSAIDATKKDYEACKAADEEAAKNR